MKKFIKKYKNKIITVVVFLSTLCCCSTSYLTAYSFNFNKPKGHEVSNEEILKFPDGFLWGAATASYQVEGGNYNSNWWRFEQQEGAIKNGDSAEIAIDHYNKFEEDFDLARELSLNSYRFSIEWSRIEPERGVFDMEEIEHYRAVLEALHERDIEPLVTLWHFSVPIWFEDEGGWENDKALDYYREYTEFVVRNLQDEVKMWITMNEPMAFITCTYISAKWAPAEVDFSKVMPIFINLVKAHKSAYEVIHQIDHDAEVGISEHSSFIAPYNEKNVFENLGAYLSTYLWVEFPIEQIIDYVDFLGIHYYYKQVIRVDLARDVIMKRDPNEIEVESLGRIYYPQGIYEVLLRFKKYNKPIYITEIGVPDYHEIDRDQFMREHMRELYYAISAGVDVRGVYYWALLDSFEWTEGYGPTFGLIAVDRDTLDRSIKDDAWEYALIAGCNCVGNE